MQLKGSGIPLTIRIRNPSSFLKKTYLSDWNPVPWIRNPRRNPESLRVRSGSGSVIRDHSDRVKSVERTISTLDKDSWVHLIYHDPSDHGSLIRIRIIPKERNLRLPWILLHGTNKWWINGLSLSYKEDKQMDCISKQVVFLFARETYLPIKLKLDSFKKVHFGHLCINPLLPSSTFTPPIWSVKWTSRLLRWEFWKGARREKKPRLPRVFFKEKVLEITLRELRSRFAMEKS